MIITGKTFGEERALYAIDGADIADCAFDGTEDGESALKESRNVTVRHCLFNLRYPLWHTENAVVHDSEMTGNCRAAIWYGKNITLAGCALRGIKALRECEDVTLTDCRAKSPEMLWKCRRVSVTDTDIVSEYPFFECSDVDARRLTLKGKYSFQYTENMRLTDCSLDTKDAFWHAKNVTVEDSVICGEYLGWYSENLRLVRCRIIGTQPLCYCRALVLEDCVMESADLAFERSEVTATVCGHIDSVKDPLRGTIRAESIGEIIMDHAIVDPADTEIYVK